MPVGMSVVGGGAEVVCQGLSGPFLAKSGSESSDMHRVTSPEIGCARGWNCLNRPVLTSGMTQRF